MQQDILHRQIGRILLDKNLTKEELNVLNVLSQSSELVESLEMGIQYEIEAFAKGADQRLYMILSPLSCSRNWALHEQLLVLPASIFFDKFKALPAES
jgi:hypothetical protein